LLAGEKKHFYYPGKKTKRFHN